MGEELTRENEIEGRCKEYFVHLLNGDEIREVGGDRRKERIRENEREVREVVREEIKGVLKKMKGGKVAGMYGILVKNVKNECICIIDRLLRIFNKYMESGVVAEDWKVASIVPVYKRKCDRRDCANYR